MKWVYAKKTIKEEGMGSKRPTFCK